MADAASLAAVAATVQPPSLLPLPPVPRPRVPSCCSGVAAKPRHLPASLPCSRAGQPVGSRHPVRCAAGRHLAGLLAGGRSGRHTARCGPAAMDGNDHPGMLDGCVAVWLSARLGLLAVASAEWVSGCG